MPGGNVRNAAQVASPDRAGWYGEAVTRAAAPPATSPAANTPSSTLASTAAHRGHGRNDAVRHDLVDDAGVDHRSPTSSRCCRTETGRRRATPRRVSADDDRRAAKARLVDAGVLAIELPLPGSEQLHERERLVQRRLAVGGHGRPAIRDERAFSIAARGKHRHPLSQQGNRIRPQVQHRRLEPHLRGRELLGHHHCRNRQ